jgi:hypothetical protein
MQENSSLYISNKILWTFKNPKINFIHHPKPLVEFAKGLNTPNIGPIPIP